ncbi:inverse autotransporter beta domain-containing protein [Xenorhabdus sp. Sc-CR9]|uniref:inverse autotransporter beta domain-containing protein n=2 Tax=Xenorhabdus TaxID=626 RepID=UPI001F40D4CB|nr:inverse autotransporter beta domain-containing protein [Xenorhabdus sp. Sc-CR9]
MLKKQGKQWTDKQRHRLKQMAWINIFAQVAFPVAGAFTPALAIAKTEHVAQEIQHHQQIRSYRLMAGESVKTVSKRHGMTVSALKKLNQHRAFNKPFSALGAGDEIEVPHTSTDKLLSESLTRASAVSQPEHGNTEHWLAGAASHAAGMLKSGNIVDSTKNQLRGMALSETNQTVQNWLQRYGTVKVQANMDDRGRLEGSQFDMLLPLYDTEKQMAFTQFGLRHIDSRTTANVGLGQRHFLDSALLGYNAFLDHDITRDHTRFGVGAEYARDFMKFGANGYFRASGWKDGKKLHDYEERPANGFDVRAEGYIPSYPQLGGKLIYEQYFGDEVGLLSEERRQKNPAAFTLGANYTPIPLVTLGLDRRQSASGGGETLFNFGLNYEIGTPWSKQVDPDAMAFKRSLQGGRYDLVERNNQIVLEYRKKQLIRLIMENQISGRGGAVMPLNVSVSAKHGLKEIVWDTAALVAAGGKLENASTRTAGFATESVRGGTHYLLTLPLYQEKGNNIYSLSGIAYDTQGNASERMEAQIMVVASAVNPGGSGFEPANKSMVADGKSQTIIRLKLTDNDGKPVSGAAGNITFGEDKSLLTGSGKDKDPVLGSEIREVPAGSGIYEITATAGTKNGKWSLTPTVDGHALTPTVVDFGTSLSEMIDTDKTEFKPANGTLNQEGDSTEIILNLKGKDGNPITGVADKIRLTDDKSELYGQAPNPTLGDIREDPPGSGTYKTKVTAGKKKGIWALTPVVDGKELKPTHMTFGQSLADIVDIQYSAFTPATNVLTANNEDNTIMTLYLKDKDGKPIPNAKDSITFENNGDQLTGDGKNKPTIDKVWEEPENSGIYKVKVKAGDKTGQWKVITKIDGKPLETPTEITFGTSIADLIDLNKSEFIPEKGKLPNKGDTTVIRLNLKDINGHPVTGVEDHINLIPDNHELYGKGEMPTHGKAKEVPPGSGIYEVPVTAGEKQGQWVLTPEVFGKKMKRPATVDFGQTLSEALDSQGSTVAPTDGSNALPADGISTKKIRIELKDKQGHPLTGAKDSIRVAGIGGLKGEGKDPQIGEIREVSEGIYETVITAGNNTGNWTLVTTVDGTDMKKETVLEFDTLNAPSISQLIVIGNMELGGQLNAIYQFEPNGGNDDDHSFFVWGAENTTAEKAKSLAKAADIKEGKLSRIQVTQEGLMQFGNVTKRGKVPVYTIPPEANGKILELSVLAANAVNIGESTVNTVVLRKGEPGNQVKGGNNQGGVADPSAKPSIDKIVLSGDLEINKPLTATYTFNDNGGDATDNSQFVWHDKEEAPQDFQPVPDTSGILTKNLVQDDAGKTIAITVKPINGKQGTGELKMVDTGIIDPDINKTVSKGGKLGTILDPAAKPAIEDLMLSGKLYIDEVLTANYTFNPQNGDITDNSEYVWKRFKPGSVQREDVLDPEAKGIVDGKKIPSGKITSYTLGNDDIGKLLELTITPKNSLNGTGEPVVINTGLDNSVLEGGDSQGGIINPTLGPIIEGLTINGTLEMGKTLTGSYIFKSNGGDDKDNSIFAWGIKYPASADPNAPKSPEESVSDLGQDPVHVIKPDKSESVPEYTLQPEDSGRIIQLAMVPRNILGIRGEQVATDTKQETQKGTVTGGNSDGTIKGVAGDFGITSNKTEEDADGTPAVKVKNTDSDPIKFTINTTGADGKSVGGVPVTIKMTAMNRQKASDKATVKLDAQKGKLEGKDNAYSGYTDEKGNLVINMTDPNGIGTRTTLSVKVNDGANLPPKTWDVIFTVITSPDTDRANYWGHMEETIKIGNYSFYRPHLSSEMRAGGINNSEIADKYNNHESWGKIRWNRTSNYCQKTFNASLPTIAIARELAEHNLSTPQNNLYTAYGWPVNNTVNYPIWTSEYAPQAPANIAVVNLVNNITGHSGSSNSDGGGLYIPICRK